MRIALGKDLCQPLLQIFGRRPIEGLAVSLAKGEMDLRSAQGQPGEHIHHMTKLGLLPFKKLASCWLVEKEIANPHLGPRRTAALVDLFDHPGGDSYAGTYC